MTLKYVYTDAFLKGRITKAIEDRAIAEVEDMYGKFEEPWAARCVIPRAYIIAALENATGSASDDPYLAKAKSHREELSQAVESARRAQSKEPTAAWPMTIKRARC